MNQENEPYLIIKISLLGVGGVGKTSLAKRLCHNQFDPNSKATIGVDFFKYDIPIIIDNNETVIRLSIWDFGGQENFKQFFTSYIIGTNGIMMVFDLKNINSLLGLEWWWKKLIAYGLNKVPKIIIGTKNDLIDYNDNKKKIYEAAIKKNICKYEEKDFIKTSSKENFNIFKCFRELTRKVLEKNLINYV